MARRLVTVAMVAMGFGVFGVPFTSADTQDIIEPQFDPPNAAQSGFQSGTCEEDVPVPPPGIFCSEETDERFYATAAGHPPMGFTQYFIQHAPFTPLPSPPFPPGSVTAPIKEPIEDRTIRTLRTDLPAGLTVNPEATPRCPLSAFEFEAGGFVLPKCDPSTIVGRNETTLVTNVDEFEIAMGLKVPKGFVVPPSEASGTRVPLYNLEPEFGEPAKLGFVIAGKRKIFLETEVAWESDYHESFTIKLPEPSAPFSTLRSRLVSKGRSGNGTYITNPTTCFDPETPEHENTYTTFFRAESWGEPNPTFPTGSTMVGSELPEGIIQEGCDTVPFEPAIGVDAGTAEVDSPAAPKVVVTLPFKPDPTGREQSHLRNAEIVMPAGMGLNPSAAEGLESCTDQQFGKGVRVEDNSCPAASKVGTAEVDSPPLHDPLKGNVYIGEQLSRDPTSGDEFRIFVEAQSKEEGISARLIGKVFADPQTGNLKAAFFETPQVPFETVTLTLERQVLTSPPVCGTHTTTTAMEPWARPGTAATPAGSFELSGIPGGGACPTTMAERPFAPDFKAKSQKKKGGARSPFRVHIDRSDGQQELRGVNVTLPKGLIGKLKGLRYCPEAAIEAAAARAGEEERGDVSCPDKSWLGRATTGAGTGSNPLEIPGNVYLAGPYKGAPLSLVVITPAVAGPFDLGTVVVRVALFVKPRTAQVRAVSDLIPNVYGGVKLDIRSIDVNVTRKGFMRNPTGCGKKKVVAFFRGGGADPTDPATFSGSQDSAAYRATRCKQLPFEPHLSTRLLGGADVTTRGKHPALRAVLEARGRDANIKRAAVALPHALFLDQGNIRTVCTKPQLAARECPKAAIYGHARAITPLLAKPLKGPVYMVSSKNELPDLVADLRGQVDVRLYGVISSVRGGIKTVFNSPDVAVKRFVLNMKGGSDRGLLINSTNLCAGPLFSVMNLKAQNGKHLRDNTLPLRVGACGKR
jgi:hypothetical protein